MGRCTEMGRVVGNDAMDVIGGAGICKGPMNYMAAKCVSAAAIGRTLLVVSWGGPHRCMCDAAHG